MRRDIIHDGDASSCPQTQSEGHVGVEEVRRKRGEIEGGLGDEDG
jgi:hypothetical protein